MQGVTSADTARIRLHGVVAEDRKACGDGKWVKVRNGDKYAFISAYSGWRSTSENSREIQKHWIKEAKKKAKDAYRWVYRR